MTRNKVIHPPSGITPEAALRSRALGARLLDVLATPGDVFAEVIAAPPKFANWLVPTLLLCLATLLTDASTSQPPMEGKMLRLLSACLGPAAGTLWSALVLWLIGRVFLRTHFTYRKTLEVAGLSGMVLLLGSITTTLLIWACGDVSARPALSLLFLHLDPSDRLRASLDVLNLFHFWAAGVLAAGLASLSAVTFKEAAFWVFSYWIVVRIALIWLA